MATSFAGIIRGAPRATSPDVATGSSVTPPCGAPVSTSARTTTRPCTRVGTRDTSTRGGGGGGDGGGGVGEAPSPVLDDDVTPSSSRSSLLPPASLATRAPTCFQGSGTVTPPPRAAPPPLPSTLQRVPSVGSQNSRSSGSSVQQLRSKIQAELSAARRAASLAAAERAASAAAAAVAADTSSQPPRESWGVGGHMNGGSGSDASQGSVRDDAACGSTPSSAAAAAAAAEAAGANVLPPLMVLKAIQARGDMFASALMPPANDCALQLPAFAAMLEDFISAELRTLCQAHIVRTRAEVNERLSLLGKLRLTPVDIETRLTHRLAELVTCNRSSSSSSGGGGGGGEDGGGGIGATAVSSLLPGGVFPPPTTTPHVNGSDMSAHFEATYRGIGGGGTSKRRGGGASLSSVGGGAAASSGGGAGGRPAHDLGYCVEHVRAVMSNMLTDELKRVTRVLRSGSDAVDAVVVSGHAGNMFDAAGNMVRASASPLLFM